MSKESLAGEIMYGNLPFELFLKRMVAPVESTQGVPKAPLYVGGTLKRQLSMGGIVDQNRLEIALILIDSYTYEPNVWRMASFVGGVVNDPAHLILERERVRQYATQSMTASAIEAFLMSGGGKNIVTQFLRKEELLHPKAEPSREALFELARAQFSADVAAYIKKNMAPVPASNKS